MGLDGGRWVWAGPSRRRLGPGVKLAVDGAQRAHLLVGVIGRADEGSALNPAEADFHSVSLQLGELVGGVVAFDRQVFSGGLQVLADGQDIDAPRAQIAPRA